MRTDGVRALLRGLTCGIAFAFAAVGTAPIASGQETILATDQQVALPGSTVNLILSITPIANVTGISLGVCFDPSSISSAMVTPIGPAIGFSFFSATPLPEGFGVSAVPDFMIGGALAPGPTYEFAQLTMVLDPGSQGFVPVEVCELAPPYQVIVNQTASILHPVTVAPGGIQISEAFLRGDFDRNGVVQLLDAIQMLNYGFLGGAAPECLGALDFDGNQTLEITLEAIQILSFLFLGAAPPASPFPDCGFDLQWPCETPGSGC